MRKTWLLFSQAVTVAVAVLFVVATLKPEWIRRGNNVVALPSVVTIAGRADAPAAAGAAVLGVAAVTSYSAAAKRASPAVVSITASKAPPRSPRSDDPVFQYFFGDRSRQSQAEPQVGLGSGVIVSADGYLLTNNHVIDGADDIEVMLTDGRQARAKVVGTDPETDVAVLKIELDKLPAITFGDADKLQVGDVVLAIGNPFGVGQTVTSGIVSALGRNQLGINTFENFIQTDAAINPGNSGGALVDANGNLLGINTAIYSRTGGSLGIGFAIPVSTARQVMEGADQGRPRHARLHRRRAARPHARDRADAEPADQAGRADHRRAAKRAGERRRPAAGRRGREHRRHAGREHAAAAECGCGAAPAGRRGARRAARRQGARA